MRYVIILIAFLSACGTMPTEELGVDQYPDIIEIVEAQYTCSNTDDGCETEHLDEDISCYR